MKKQLTVIATLAIIAGGIAWAQMPAGYTVKPELVGKELQGGKLLLTYRSDTATMVYPGPVFVRRVWREVYGASNGVVVLERTIEAQVTPAQEVPEKVEWPK